MKEPNISCFVCGVLFYRNPLIKRAGKIVCSINCGTKLLRRGEWASCQCCSTVFYRTSGQAKKGFGKFCCRKCEALSRPNGPVTRVCGQCGNEFKKPWHDVYRGTGGKFCSRACIDKFKRKLRKRGEQEMFTGWQKREWLSDVCLKCGTREDLQLDHKIPRFAGGKATRENAQTLCGPCNRQKFWVEDYPLYQHNLKQRAKRS